MATVTASTSTIMGLTESDFSEWRVNIQALLQQIGLCKFVQETVTNVLEKLKGNQN